MKTIEFILRVVLIITGFASIIVAGSMSPLVQAMVLLILLLETIK